MAVELLVGKLKTNSCSTIINDQLVYIVVYVVYFVVVVLLIENLSMIVFFFAHDQLFINFSSELVH